MMKLSVCVITKNEERSLGRALDSLSGIADEVVVVDCGSTDATKEIAESKRARFIFREWSNYSEQKNFAAQCASNDWIFSMDADEELSAELRESLAEWKASEPRCAVYEIARRTWYLGAWIRHSGWYPDFQRRIYRRGSAQFAGTVHESLRFTGEAGRIEGDLLHYTVGSFAEHEVKAERYATLAAQQMFARGRRSWRGAMWFGTPWSWMQNFFLRGGLLDGWRGALISQMAARSVRMKYQKLGELVKAAQRSG